MFQRGRVENDFRALLPEPGHQDIAVTDVAKGGRAGQIGETLLKLLIDRIEIELGILDQGDPARRKRGDLPDQLRANGPTRTGYEYSAAADEARHRQLVKRHGRTAQEFPKGQ